MGWQREIKAEKGKRRVADWKVEGVDEAGEAFCAEMKKFSQREATAQRVQKKKKSILEGGRRVRSR
jgi:hypothetical protein